MSKLRSIAAALVVSLLLVPALARAGQALDTGCHPAPSVGFSKSVDVPPDLVSVPPDLSVTPLDVETLLHPVRGVLVSLEETLPTPPDLLDIDSLRGPPLA